MTPPGKASLNGHCKAQVPMTQRFHASNISEGTTDIMWQYFHNCDAPYTCMLFYKSEYSLCAIKIVTTDENDERGWGRKETIYRVQHTNLLSIIRFYVIGDLS